MQKFLINMIDAILKYMLLGGDIDFTKNIINAIAKAMTADASGFGLFGAGTVGEAVSQAFRAYAIALLAIYLVQDIYEQSSIQEISVDMLVRSFIKLALSYVGIQCMYDGLVYAVRLGGALSNGFAAAAWGDVNIDRGMTLIHKYLKGLNIFAVSKFSLLIISFLFPYIILWGTRLIIFAAAAVCAIKLSVSIILSPFALGNFFGDRNRAAGWAFIRQFFGLIIQGLGIMIILWAGSAITYAQLRSSKDSAQLINDMHDPSQKIESYRMNVMDAEEVVRRIGVAYGTPLTAPLSLFKDAKALISGEGKTASQTIVDDVIQKGAGADLIDEIMDGNSLIKMCVVQCAVAASIRKLDGLIRDVLTY